MDETVPTAAPEPPRAPHAVDRIARALALLGGVVALAVAGVVVVSVARRWLFSEPIPGDFELAQIGTAVAVFAFLPYCQVMRGNIVVDTFTANLSTRARHRIDALWDLVYAAAMALVAVCLGWGTRDMLVSQEVSMLLRIPVWPGVAFGAVCCAFLALVALCTAVGLIRNRS